MSSFSQPPLHRQNPGYAPGEKGKRFHLCLSRSYDSSQIYMNVKPFRLDSNVIHLALRLATCAHVKQKDFQIRENVSQ